MIRVGDRASLTRAFEPQDLSGFSVLADMRPDDDTGLSGMVPEPLVGALFSCLLGTRLPGPGTGWLKQSLHHHAPAQLRERLTATVEVVRLRPDKRLVDLACTCHGAEGRLICAGRALILLGPSIVD